MNVFVTGASGYIGRTVARRLAAAGHRVTALARSERAAETVRALGATAVTANLGDTVGWQALAWAHDAAIHIAQEHSTEGPAKDRAAIDTFVRASEVGRLRSFLYTSGVWVLGDRPTAGGGEEATTENAPKAVAWRVGHEHLVRSSRSERLRTAVIRPGIVYGGRGGLVDIFLETAHEEGAASFVGDGRNRWSLVHLEDLADLYLKLLETDAAGTFHAVDGAPLTVGEIAQECSQAAGAGGTVRPVPLDQARRAMGDMADALVMDQVVSAPASAALGWRPARPRFDAAAACAEWSR